MTPPKPTTSLLHIAHEVVKNSLYPGAIAIDATIGNGHDTLFLARQVADSGLVYGFDIQPEAIKATRSKLQAAYLLKQTRLNILNHAHLLNFIPQRQQGKVAAIMFNLGYLPGGNKQIMTQLHSTITALNAATTLLSPKGILTILAYPGHQGGDTETVAVEQWHKALNQKHYRCTLHESNQATLSSPKLLIIEKNTGKAA